MLLRLKRRAARAVRSALIRWAAAPRRRAPPHGRPHVYILLMHAWGMGGTIRTTLSVAGHLAKSHEVEILSVVRRRDEPFFEFPAGVTVTALDDQRPGAKRGWRRLLGSQRSRLVPVVDRAARSCSLWSDLRLVGVLRSRPPGVLIGTRSGLNMVVAEVAPPGFVKVGQEHLNFEVKSAELKHAIRRRFRGLDLLLVLTQTDLARYARALGDSVSVERMPNAVPRGGPPKTTREGTTILAAGRLTRQKGFDRLVPAFGRVVERHPDWKLRLCGAGAERERLEQMVADHGLSEHVSLPGAVPLEREMAAASMFVISSRFEGFPMVLLEAMGHGLPVVSFDCPTGPREVIEPRVNGLLAAPDSVQALATAMLEMIEDEPLRRRCAEGALETARDYSLDAIGPRWDALIGRLTRESGTVGSPPCSPR